VVRIRREERDWLGLALATAAGFGVGLVVGMAGGEFLGDVTSERMKRLMRATPPRGDDTTPSATLDADAAERAVSGALSEHPTTRSLAVHVRALGDGIVELMGQVPDRTARELAGTVARGVAGADVVVNRILVEGEDLPTRKPSRAG
jgi:osmotically-inducible protein OsmY